MVSFEIIRKVVGLNIEEKDEPTNLALLRLK